MLKGTIFLFLFLTGLTSIRNLSAHESLYNTAEIHLTSPETVTIHFSIHAPEILLDSDMDTSNPGDEWLKGLTDSEIAELIIESDTFVKERYEVKIGSVNLLEDGNLAFESPFLIRTPNREGGPRPGCLLATFSFQNPGGSVDWIYQEGGEKRLLLGEIRPAAFPRTHDLEAGSSISIQLPEPPPSPNQPWLLSAAALAFALLIGLYFRKKTSTLTKES